MKPRKEDVSQLDVSQLDVSQLEYDFSQLGSSP